MTVPLIILAVLSTVGGLVGIPYALSGGCDAECFRGNARTGYRPCRAEGTRDQTASRTGCNDVARCRSGKHAVLPLKLASLRMSAGGHAEHSAEELCERSECLPGFPCFWHLSVSRSASRCSAKRPSPKMPKILAEKWRIDEFYNGYIVDPITNLSREGLWKGFDLGFIDGIVNGIGTFRHRARPLAPPDPGRIRPQLRGDHSARSSRGAWVLYLLRFETSWLVVRCSWFVEKKLDDERRSTDN